jgi:hypothetical protein
MSTAVRIRDRYFYATKMTRESYEVLSWIADRYESAGVLYDGSRTVRSGNDSVILLTPESCAHDYLTALSEENGDDMVIPPCAGGPLADALLALWETVV